MNLRGLRPQRPSVGLLAELVYCYVLRPPPLRRATNAALRAILPEHLQRYGVSVAMNPRDPVVSGALTLGVYERDETAWFRDALRPGMTVLDVGANIGWYTALAGRAVGASGRVVALEPDPESFGFLERTVVASGLDNVRCRQVAAVAERGSARLFQSEDNRGDNRLYEPGPGWGSIEVDAVPADEVLAEEGIDRLDLVKIDVQGCEAGVISGLAGTIARSPGLRLLTEFWPWGLARAGGEATAFLDALRDLGLELSHLAPGGPRPLRTRADDDDLISRYQGRRYTNLVGVRPR